jgi:hypothetical protein
VPQSKRTRETDVWETVVLRSGVFKDRLTPSAVPRFRGSRSRHQLPPPQAPAYGTGFYASTVSKRLKYYPCCVTICLPRCYSSVTWRRLAPPAKYMMQQSRMPAHPPNELLLELFWPNSENATSTSFERLPFLHGPCESPASFLLLQAESRNRRVFGPRARSPILPFCATILDTSATPRSDR